MREKYWFEKIKKLPASHLVYTYAGVIEGPQTRLECRGLQTELLGYAAQFKSIIDTGKSATRI